MSPTITELLLFDILFKDFGDFVGAFLWVPLLSTLVVDVRDSESRCVTLGPLEVAASSLLAVTSVPECV
jgi:hypothetical protein